MCYSVSVRVRASVRVTVGCLTVQGVGEHAAADWLVVGEKCGCERLWEESAVMPLLKPFSELKPVRASSVGISPPGIIGMESECCDFSGGGLSPPS